MATFVTAVSEYAKDPNLNPEDIVSLRNWLEKQPHLPQQITDEFLISILHSSEYSVEKAKQLVEKNIFCRTNFTEMFSERDPLSPQNLALWEYFEIWVGPKVTEDKCRVCFIGFNNFDPEHFNFAIVLKTLINVLDTTLAEKGICPGYIFIFNCEGVTLSHVAKMNISYIRNYLHFLQEAINIKIKAMHVINVFSIIDKIMLLFKPFMKKELLDIMYFHSGEMEDFYKSVPRDILPAEIGGTMGHKKEIVDEVKNRLERLRTWVIDQESLQIDESKRTDKKGQLQNMSGSFRKLQLD